MDSNQTWQKYYSCGKSSEYKKKINPGPPYPPWGRGNVSSDSEPKQMKAHNLKIIEKLRNVMHICQFKMSRSTNLIGGVIIVATPQSPPGIDPRGPVWGTNRNNGPILMKFGMNDSGGVRNKTQSLNFSSTPIYPPWGKTSPSFGELLL